MTLAFLLHLTVPDWFGSCLNCTDTKEGLLRVNPYPGVASNWSATPIVIIIGCSAKHSLTPGKSRPMMSEGKSAKAKQKAAQPPQRPYLAAVNRQA